MSNAPPVSSDSANQRAQSNEALLHEAADRADEAETRQGVTVSFSEFSGRGR